ncbi:MAG TPA: DUF2845 domain-containing protein [Steroidobacteraceae bacterium]|jgi:hypothetical protein
MLRLHLIAVAATFTGLVAPVSPAHGETFRCGQWIASPDMSVEELLEKCGEPTMKTSETVDVYARTAAGGRVRTGTTIVETWTYDRGSQSFDMVVTIVDGRIRSMERGK